MMRYDLLSLEIFMAVAEQRNLTRAAERCHLATSAVSKRISELEARVGAPLFVRAPRGMELTPAGQSLHHHVRQLRATLQQMDRELSEYGAGVTGHLRLHAITSALAQQLTLDIAGFMQAHPMIRFDIEEGVGTGVVTAVADGRADLGIIAEQTPTLGLASRPYRSDELVLVMAARHPLAERTRVSLAEALPYEFIGSHPDSSLQQLLSVQAALLGQALRQRVRVGSFECMCRMAATNLGICLLPRDVAASHRQALDLRLVGLEDGWARRQLLLVTRDFGQLPAVAHSFVEHLGG